MCLGRGWNYFHYLKKKANRGVKTSLLIERYCTIIVRMAKGLLQMRDVGALSLTIQVSNASSTHIPPSICHISIIVENTDVQDRITFEDCKRNLYTLDKRLKAENLPTLLLFGDYCGSFCKPISYIFREAKARRVIFLSGASYDVEDLLHNFSQLVHLCYLRISGKIFNERFLSSSVSRLYNLLVLDLKECQNIGCTRELSNLVKIRHLFVEDEMGHCGIYEVGNLKNIQELRRFEVKREKHGFELRVTRNS